LKAQTKGEIVIEGLIPTDAFEEKPYMELLYKPVLRR